MHDDDLERTLHDSLEQRARHLGEPNVSLDAVWHRVDRRRNQRRGVAVIGSCAAVGIGVLGIAALAGRTPGEGPSAAGGTGSPAPSIAFASTTVVSDGLWRCTGLVGGDGTYQFFETCEPIPGGTPLTLPPGYGGTAPPSFLLPGVYTVPPTPSPPIYRQGDHPPQAREYEVLYEVGPGDSLSSIAELFNVPIEAIPNWNGWVDGIEHPIIVGEIIGIGPNEVPPSVVDCGITTTTMLNGDFICAAHPSFPTPTAPATTAPPP